MASSGTWLDRHLQVPAASDIAGRPVTIAVRVSPLCGLGEAREASLDLASGLLNRQRWRAPKSSIDN